MQMALKRSPVALLLAGVDPAEFAPAACNRRGLYALMYTKPASLTVLCGKAKSSIVSTSQVLVFTESALTLVRGHPHARESLSGARLCVRGRCLGDLRG